MEKGKKRWMEREKKKKKGEEGFGIEWGSI